MNFAGQPAARLNRNQAIYDVKAHKSLLITILSPALFFAPDVHLKKLESVFVDEMVNQVPWKAFILQLQEEWREFIVYVRTLFRRLLTRLRLTNLPFVQSTIMCQSKTLVGPSPSLTLLRRQCLQTRHSSLYPQLMMVPSSFEIPCKFAAMCPLSRGKLRVLI